MSAFQDTFRDSATHTGHKFPLCRVFCGRKCSRTRVGALDASTVRRLPGFSSSGCCPPFSPTVALKWKLLSRGQTLFDQQSLKWNFDPCLKSLKSEQLFRYCVTCCYPEILAETCWNSFYKTFYYNFLYILRYGCLFLIPKYWVCSVLSWVKRSHKAASNLLNLALAEDQRRLLSLQPRVWDWKTFPSSNATNN